MTCTWTFFRGVPDRGGLGRNQPGDPEVQPGAGIYTSSWGLLGGVCLKLLETCLEPQSQPETAWLFQYGLLEILYIGNGGLRKFHPFLSAWHWGSSWVPSHGVQDRRTEAGSGVEVLGTGRPGEVVPSHLEAP